jgi:hypothetical protein
MAAYLGRELVHRNVEIVQAMYEAFARRELRNYSTLDEALRAIEPE